MREVAVSIFTVTRVLAEDLVPALAVFAAIFSVGIYAKGLVVVPYSVGAF